MNYVGPALLILLLAGIFISFWRSAKKHEQAELARLEDTRRKEEKAKREAEAHRIRKEAAAVAKKATSRSLPRAPESSRPIGATPRKAAPAPTTVKRVERRTTSTYPSAPAAAPDTSYEDGVVTGLLMSNLLTPQPSLYVPDPAPSYDPPSTGGGDFGGGGASSSWSDSSSSSSYDSGSACSFDSGSSSSFD